MERATALGLSLGKVGEPSPPKDTPIQEDAQVDTGDILTGPDATGTDAGGVELDLSTRNEDDLSDDLVSVSEDDEEEEGYPARVNQMDLVT